MLSYLRRNTKRVAIVVVGGAAALAITGGAFASPHNGHGQHLSSKPGYIVAKGHTEQGLRFSSTTIERGQKLHIVNNTPAPHSFTLVIPKLVPHSKGQEKKCFSPGHICLKAAKWHKFDGQNIHRNPVRAGKHGWDDEGSLHREGDSVLFGDGFGPSSPNNRKVTAPAGTVLHFMCIIHPWMHGTVTVTN